MITKAVIPVAGRATRLQPWAAAVSKALLPLVDGAGRLRPIIHFVIEEAFALASMQSVALVVSADQVQPLRNYFDAAARLEGGEMFRRLEWVVQDHPRGLGHAMLMAQAFVGDQPFLAMLGDQMYQAAPAALPMSVQLAAAYGLLKHPAALIGMCVVEAEELSRVGAAGGDRLGPNLYHCRSLIEKPSLYVARRELTTADLPADRFLAHSGLYVFGPDIFDCLGQLASVTPAGAEVQLTAAQQMLLNRRNDDYYLLRLQGQNRDVGTPQTYARTFVHLAEAPSQARD